ncbi:MAG TPA: hypothetical protein DDZ11_10975 [Lentisphaeria bacterium]|nr:hypothetical protein [Lentisphaeria bacterium]
MKTKITTLFLLFFAILSSHGEDKTVVHRYAREADGIYSRTMARIAEGWIGARENFDFAMQTVKDKAVNAEREARGRARLTYENVRDETVRKTRELSDDIQKETVRRTREISESARESISNAGRQVSRQYHETSGKIREKVRE